MNEDLAASIEAHKAGFRLEITSEEVSNLSLYYELLGSHNDRLHLVARCSPEEFAVRHILESLFIAEILPIGANVVDVGSGAGLPGIPLAIYRDDLKLTVIESKKKKAEFLELAVEGCGLSGRVNVINRQFSESMIPGDSIITARALDKFAKVLPKLAKWASGRRMILFGGPSLKEALDDKGIAYGERLIPLSEQRFVFDTGMR